MGRPRYPNATERLITADGGDSNSSRCRLWKIALQELADATGLTLHVSHFPPSTSKWNKIEHRLFCHVTQNWRGRPLVSHDLIVKLAEQIRTGAYAPKAIRRSHISKADGTQRPLGIPTVSDRIVQGCVRHVIEPIFEKQFAAQSYGFRPGRSCRDALRRVQELLTGGHDYVVDADLTSYFDAIPHERLMEQVRKHVADSRVLQLIRAFLEAKIMERAAQRRGRTTPGACIREGGFRRLSPPQRGDGR